MKDEEDEEDDYSSNSSNYGGVFIALLCWII